MRLGLCRKTVRSTGKVKCSVVLWRRGSWCRTTVASGGGRKTGPASDIDYLMKTGTRPKHFDVVPRQAHKNLLQQARRKARSTIEKWDRWILKSIDRQLSTLGELSVRYPFVFLGQAVIALPHTLNKISEAPYPILSRPNPYFTTISSL